MSAQMRCPRCKLDLTAGDVEALTDVMLEHLQTEHGHQPPREHVIARIRRRNPPPVSA